MKRGIIAALVIAPLFLSGCVLDTIMKDVVANKPPRAVVDAAPQEGGAPLAVTFNADYSHDDDGEILDYHWDFGDPTDPTPSRSPTATHTYAHPGTHLAKLTVTDDSGAIGSQRIAIVVTDPAPVAQATVSKSAPYPGDTVTFDASASSDYNGEIVQYSWDFGDGGSAEGVRVTHSYVEGGYYIVTLTVVDAAGQTATTRLNMNVQPGKSNCGGSDDDTCGSGGSSQPYAVITGNFSCSGGTVGEPIRFDGSWSRPGVGRITSYHWEFGDGATASGAIVAHTYERTGRFVIRLTVTDEGGGTNTASGQLSIGTNCY